LRPKITEPNFLALFEREDFEEEPEERKEILELGINHGLKTNKKYGFSRFFSRGATPKYFSPLELKNTCSFHISKNPDPKTP
jgi:hypothetical protein